MVTLPRRLVGLIFDRARKIDKDGIIKSVDEKEIGRMTSHTLSPHLGCTIALGYVKYDYLASDTEVRVSSSPGDLQARVAALPFVRGQRARDRIKSGSDCLK